MMISLRRGCPIRIFLDQNLLAVPQDFSQRATSFVASWCQGIHRMPFCRSIFDPKTVSHSPPKTRTRFLACPPCTGTIHQSFLGIDNASFAETPLGTGHDEPNLIENSNNAFMRRQKRTRHGHHNRATYAIIHLNTQNFGDYA